MKEQAEKLMDEIQECKQDDLKFRCESHFGMTVYQIRVVGEKKLVLNYVFWLSKSSNTLKVCHYSFRCKCKSLMRKFSGVIYHSYISQQVKNMYEILMERG